MFIVNQEVLNQILKDFSACTTYLDVSGNTFIVGLPIEIVCLKPQDVNNKLNRLRTAI